MSKCKYLIILSLMFALPSVAEEIDFGQSVWPIIEARCIECHGPEKQKEGIRFDDLLWLKDDELLGGGDARASLIFELVTMDKDDDGYMPKKRDRLGSEELEILSRWLNEGGNAPGWTVPEIVLINMMSSSEKRLALLAENLSPASNDALNALRDVGAVVVQLADSNNLIRVDFGLHGNDIGDEELALLEPLSEHLTVLGLANTNITNTGLEVLANYPKLTQLLLGNTGVSDTGIESLSESSNLEVLNIINTKITDAALDSIKDLEYLTSVYAWGSEITPNHARKFMDQRLDVRIDLGLGTRLVAMSKDISELFDEGSCCAIAHSKNKSCEHACCQKASTQDEICPKCNPGAR